MVAAQTDLGIRRVERLRQVMAEAGVDVVIIAPSADLRYLAGYGAHPSERPTLLAVTPSAAVMLLPVLEAPRLADSDFHIVSWEETDDPYALLAGVLRDLAVDSVAVSDQMWAAILLGLQEALPGSQFTKASTVLGQLRMLKSAREIDFLARAGAMADAAFAEIVREDFAGRTEREIGQALAMLLERQGLEVSGGVPIVASGPNSASPHHLTGNRRIEEGDAVVLDFGGTFEGYHADISRTVHVGMPDDDFLHLYEVVRQAQEAGVGAVRPGVPAESVDAAARGVVHAAGYGDFFIHRTGHGLGLDVHEEPYIVAGNARLLEPGMIFSVEPGIYLPGRFGVRIEDIIAVTQTGARRLNEAGREVVVVH